MDSSIDEAIQSESPGHSPARDYQRSQAHDVGPRVQFTRCRELAAGRQVRPAPRRATTSTCSSSGVSMDLVLDVAASPGKARQDETSTFYNHNPPHR